MRKLSMEELGRMSAEDFKQAEKNSIVVILDNIRSMVNVGSIFRICDAFRVEKMYLCGITPCPPHREIQKTALGATESVIWEYSQELEVVLSTLQQAGYTILAIEQTDTSIALQKYHLATEKIAVIFGNEVEGVSVSTLAYCTQAIEIPQFGTKHSLNVAVTAGIVLYEFTRLLSE